jgi:hypothetical protein
MLHRPTVHSAVFNYIKRWYNRHATRYSAILDCSLNMGQSSPAFSTTAENQVLAVNRIKNPSIGDEDVEQCHST